MIPIRVKLQGFLCYKEPQEVVFEGGSLWMLAGLNGSGKSAIFDAVTYALFGHHRGGGRDAIQLINQDSDSLNVDFEFALDGQRYLARRTLRSDGKGGARPTQQISRWQADGCNGAGRWVPVEDTRQKRGFEAWVAEHIGLSYETFISSVLLLQGKADKLLDSSPKGRHEVLATIVDLKRYAELHQRADEQRKARAHDADHLRQQLAALPVVGEDELAQATVAIAAAETAREQARAEVERLQVLELQAVQWIDLQARLAEATRRWEQAQQLLTQAGDIERDLQRLRQLREVLPWLETVFEQRNRTHDSEQKTRELTSKQRTLAEVLARHDDAIEQTRRKRAALQNRLTADEKRYTEVVGLLRQAGGLLEKLHQYEQHEADLQRLQTELARLPADPAALASQARQRQEQLADLARVVPILTRFRTRREEMRNARTLEQTASQALQEIQTRGEQLAAEVKRLKPPVEEAARARQQAEEQALTARAHLDQARQELREFQELEGAKTCRHCGQPLTPTHFRSEQQRRERTLRDLVARAEETAAAQQAAFQAERQLREKLTAAEQQYQEARDEYRDRRNQAEQSRRDVERLQRECAQVAAELPEAFRERIGPAAFSDWLATVYPTEADLEALRREASSLPAARRQLTEAERVLQQWNTLRAQETDRRQTLERLQAELPADRPAVRRTHHALEAEEQALQNSRTARRQEMEEMQRQEDRLTRERERTQRELAEVAGQLQAEETSRKLYQQALTRAWKELPDAWKPLAERFGLAQLNDWRQERDELVNRQVEERNRQLQESRVSLDVLARTRAELQAQQEQFPAEARQDPAQVRAQLAMARQEQRRCDDRLSEARQQKVLLERQREQRQQLEAVLRQVEQERRRYELLARLLGRDRLQLHLLRQAERQVVDYANAVLDRLSGGQLYLRLCGQAGGDEGSAKALELEAYNRTTAERPINVAFLSGSQKFRVAVSLALGIGKFASRQHRSIEAVIIDEGFGCLDKQGRQVMIQELQNLRSELRCILLVSHQEEFAEAFADGYHFQLDNGSTRVTRFHR